MRYAMLISIIGALLMVGCANHFHTLSPRSDPDVVSGQFSHESPSYMIIDTPIKRYEGRGFTIQSVNNLKELRERYQISSPKHWARITSGMDRDHVVYFSEPILHANTGESLKCKLSWSSGKTPAGTCTESNGKEYVVNFQ
jgi:hypothetical protein